LAEGDGDASALGDAAAVGVGLFAVGLGLADGLLQAATDNKRIADNTRAKSRFVFIIFPP